MRSVDPVILDASSRNSDTITASRVPALGPSKQTLIDRVKAGLPERVRHGVCMLPDAAHDDMYTLMLRPDSIVFFHESALFLHGLSGRTPFIHAITMPGSKAVPGSIRDECACFCVRPSWHRIGLTERQDTFGNAVPCNDAERTIRHLLRIRDRCDDETVTAEKAETILSRGVYGTGPRDLYGLYILTAAQAYDKQLFREAPEAAAAHRGSARSIADRAGSIGSVRKAI